MYSLAIELNALGVQLLLQGYFQQAHITLQLAIEVMQAVFHPSEANLSHEKLVDVYLEGMNIIRHNDDWDMKVLQDPLDPHHGQYGILPLGIMEGQDDLKAFILSHHLENRNPHIDAAAILSNYALTYRMMDDESTAAKVYELATGILEREQIPGECTSRVIISLCSIIYQQMLHVYVMLDREEDKEARHCFHGICLCEAANLTLSIGGLNAAPAA